VKSRRLQLLVSLSILAILIAGVGLYALLTYRVVQETISEQILEDSRMLASTVRDLVEAEYQIEELSVADVAELRQLCSSIAVPNSGFVCIVDPGGAIVAAPPVVEESDTDGPATSGADAGTLSDALLRQATGGEAHRLSELPRDHTATGILSYPASQRRELVASVPIGSSGYRVQVHQDYAAVTKRANDSSRSILPLGLAIAIIVSLISFFVVDRIVERYEHRLSRANAGLTEANKKLTASNNHRRHLIHVLSHDLKNAIGAILSAQEIVAAYPEERDLYQRIISEGARNSLRIVDLVRMTEAVETGKLELQLQPVHVLQSTLRAVEVVQNKVRRKGVEVDVDIDQKLYVLAEETSFINSVLVNVLSNAIKFSSRGSVITVRASAGEDDVTLTITDQGIGIPPELLDKLFEPSEPTTRPGTDGENGTGFGLPLTSKFVAAYGGSVSVESKPQNDGESGWTRVAITLPSVVALMKY
jgi:signal transduction histidine kinase